MAQSLGMIPSFIPKWSQEGIFVKHVLLLNATFRTFAAVIIKQVWSTFGFQKFLPPRSWNISTVQWKKFCASVTRVNKNKFTHWAVDVQEKGRFNY